MRTTVEDMEKVPPEDAARQVLDACADCDVCRFMIDTCCLFSPIGKGDRKPSCIGADRVPVL
jgi:hypothetical protein